ncbi:MULTISPECIES: sulfurtransferase [Corynebacterium]|uniref:Sulfurtransferase n=1 Tax=Corynebacterium glucuronolyticum TaxID=39791 RepID=A0A7T4JVQ7_9CORY|nr:MULTISPECIES: sulfurtransferase [Corynebacterium]EEI26112.1 rhodanese-like protein [Corynebacterium glucuronolyticum ATCC 51867]MCT1563479.1 sulfurtransferase [Corynebacterium glucuronolyticum]OFO43286.1 sulfultransferase [Corynebacterium sp. HMSC073D01]QQB47116.1 sulfurtransferase [Corynebacterium glucuronolyticum]QQU88773.1 sulfurtransferase [Corynebacterium glucuronolyticum]
MSILVTPEELKANLQKGGKQILLHAMYEETRSDGFAMFNASHIPTALFCDAANALAGTPSKLGGRNPLPNPDILQRWFDRWGLGDDHHVICYDEARGILAARAWFVLRWAGVKNVSVLDGGLTKWRELKYPRMGGPGNPRSLGALKVDPGHMPIVTTEDVKKHSGLLVDTRGRNRFTGKTERLDLKAGHIPGAVNVPTADFLNEDGTFKDPQVIRQAFDSKGITDASDVIIYSGSGLHSAQGLIAMELAGLPGAATYLGGWSQWCADPKNPVATGD